MYDPYQNFTKSVLPNGLTVYHQHWDRPWVAVRIIVHSGAREDAPHLPGLAHFLEHCVSNNIKGYRKIEARDFLKDTGGRTMFGTTSYLSTEYSFALPTKLSWVREALTIFGTMLFQARITKRVEKERSIIKEEFGQCYPIAEGLDWHMRQFSSIFTGHRLETYNRPLGRPEGFMNATQSDLQAFYDQHYVPANMSLVVLGGMNEQQFSSLLSKSPFAMAKPGVRNPVAKPLTVPLPRKRAGQTIKLSRFTKFKTQQAEYLASWMIPGHVPLESLILATDILDRFLEQEIREKLGGSYGFSAHFWNFQDVRLLFIVGRVNPELIGKVEGIVDDCIRRALRDKRTFDQLKTRMHRRLLMSDLSGREIVNEASSDLAGLQRIVPLTEDLRRRKRLSFEELSQTLRLLTSDRRYTFITKP